MKKSMNSSASDMEGKEEDVTGNVKTDSYTAQSPSDGDSESKRHKKSGKNSQDLTQGTPWKMILRFTLPLLGAALLQQMYSTVDLIFVGRFVGTNASAAVGSCDLLVTLLIGLFTGISTGTGVVTAQCFGAGNRRKLHDIIQTAVTFGLLGSAILFIIGQFCAIGALRLINTPEEILTQAALYLRLYFVSIFSIVLYNLCSGIIRSLGDSAATLRFQFIGGVVNVIADFVLIVIFKLGIAGAAIATFSSQTIAAVMTLWYLAHLDQDIALNFKKLYIRMAELKQILGIGVPAGCQAMIMTLSNLIVQSVINRLGIVTIAAFVVYFKAELFLWYPIVNMGQAIMTFTAQNYGAGKPERVRQGLRSTLIMGIGGTVVVSALILFFARPLFGIFNPDTAVIEECIRIAGVAFPFYFVYTIQETFAGVVKGKGNAFVPMIITIMCICVFRVCVLEILFHISENVRYVASVYPASWAAAAVCILIYFCLVQRKEEKNPG